MQEMLEEIPLDLVEINPNQPRRYFSENEIDELAQSIDTVGLIQPLRVIKKSSGKYFLLCGERRFRALLKLKKKTALACVDHQRDDIKLVALIENIQREDLNPIEVSQALQDLVDVYQINQQQLAEKVGLKRSTVANYLRLQSLPEQLQDAVKMGLISMGHAKALLAISDVEQQLKLFDMTVLKELSVRELEKEIAHMTNRSFKKIQKIENCHTSDLKRQLEHHLGTKVHLHDNKGKGRLIIDYFSYDDLDRLLEILGVFT